MEDPDPDETVRLLIDYSGVEEDTIVSQVREHGGEINKRLIRNTLSISIQEAELEDLCSLDSVVYAEVEEAWRQMEGADASDSGNFR